MGDVNGDGKPDLIYVTTSNVLTPEPVLVTVLLNDGSGGFSSAPVISSYTVPGTESGAAYPIALDPTASLVTVGGKATLLFGFETALTAYSSYSLYAETATSAGNGTFTFNTPIAYSPVNGRISTTTTGAHPTESLAIYPMEDAANRLF